MALSLVLPAPVLSAWDWQDAGLCRGMDSELFFSPESERGLVKRARVDRAKEVCGRCPVLARCRSHALEAQEPYGVWGGTTPEERERLLARRTA